MVQKDLVHVVFDNGQVTVAESLVAAFTSLKKAQTFCDGYAREHYPKMVPTERPVTVHSRKVV